MPLFSYCVFLALKYHVFINMEAILKADIFFFVTTIFVVILTVILCIVGFHLIRIMRNFSHVSDVLRETVDDAHGELQNITDQVKNSMLFSFIFGRKSGRKKKSEEKE